MLGSVFLSHVFAILHILLHRWVYNELLTNGMSGQFPSELILIANLGVVVLRAHDSIIKLFKFGMVVLDCLAD
jgi:hypothetical protein